ncbi:hypothetical protein BGZ61DRAFT_454397 [Ilyonectria robusta]|uniref:uncharacterized protein n=1 Tax=Ilyonectria robusta TaxID=1079257 RepID=UPI001E8DC741|nr:uncharacterized protein BGZ61DRAFT_454397 [Ilyonectria robusta]KAH8686380.1 hypothetical protein BGZ61DRAFT_454397 [Ilyonectria robusta]
MRGLGARLEPTVEENDPRIKDIRVGEEGNGTLSSDGSSIPSALLNTPFGPVLVAAGPTIIYTVVCCILFLALRRKIPRLYAPKSLSGIQSQQARSPELPAGWTDWIKPFFQIQDTYILERCSLDGFLFLRHLRVLCIICLGGIFFVLPILLPIHGIGGKSLSPPGSLTILNLDDSNKLYAHVAVSWVFTGFILFMIWRECLYYINIRHAYLLSPNYTSRSSSKTVLFTAVPAQYLDDGKLRKLFGDSVVNFWIPRMTGKLKKLLREREKTAVKLEEAEITLIKRANSPSKGHPQFSMTHWDWMKTPKSEFQDPERGTSWGKNHQSPTVTELQAKTLDGHSTESVSTYSEHSHLCVHDSDFPGQKLSLESQKIAAYARPSHRPVSKFGRSVDTINWARSHLKLLNEQIEELRQKIHAGKGKPMNAVFVEFDSSANAQAAYQTPTHHQPFQMSETVIGMRPGEIVWDSLRIPQWQRLIREYVVVLIIIACVIIWWIPQTLVSIVASPAFLEQQMPDINRFPQLATNIISGLGRAILLWLLLETVPFFLRTCAKFTGSPTLSAVELFVQSRYFVFQVLQIFLAPTLMPDITRDPRSILSINVPRASNLYFTYILVRCFSAGAWELTQLWELFRHQIKGKFSGTPQAGYKRWYDLSVIHWGGVYPVFTNIGVIAVCYACIAPLILVFAATGLAFVYFVYKYNLMYVYDTRTLETTGLFYPRAVMHIIAGPYLAQIFFICYFVLLSAWGQLALMVLLSFSTVFLHISIRNAINPLLDNFPRTLSHDDEHAAPQENRESAAESGFLRRRGVNTDVSAGELPVDMEAANPPWDVTPATLDEAFLSQQPPQPSKSSTYKKWFRPLAFESFEVLQRLVSHTPAEEEFPAEYESQRYLPPEVWLLKPKLWIPRDEALVSQREIALTREVLPSFDDGAWLDKKGRVKFDLEAAPLKDDLPLYQQMRLIL